MVITKTKSEPYTKDEIGKKNLIVLSSLAMDLKRAAIGLNRGSNKMANRFFEEALKRKQ